MSNWLDHSSIVGHLGKYGQKISDPLAWVLGDKYTHLVSDVLPEKVNAGMSTVMQPFEKVDKTINPVRRIPIVNRVGDIVASKPGDAAAIAAGAYFGGSALLGGGGMAGAGGAAGGAADGGLGSVAADGGLGSAAGDGAAGGFVFNPAQDSELASEAGNTGFVFNPAQDSQAANEQLGIKPGGNFSLSADQVNKIGQIMQNMSQQQQRNERPLRESDVLVDTPRLQNGYVTSTKSAKQPAVNAACVGQAVARGAAGADPIDANGMEMLSIQQLTKQLQAAKKRLAELKGAKQK